MSDGVDKFQIEQQYAWNWFSYHASQRISAFNFFLIISGATVAGYFRCVEHLDDPRWHWFGVFVGLFGVLVSVAFVLLDVRNEELVNCGRNALDILEKEVRMDIRENDFKRTCLGESMPPRWAARRILGESTPRWARCILKFVISHRFWFRVIETLTGFAFGFAAWYAWKGYTL